MTVWKCTVVVFSSAVLAVCVYPLLTAADGDGGDERFVHTYVSTPVTPPAGQSLMIPFGFLVTMACAGALAFARRLPLNRGFGLCLLVTAVFAFTFLVMGMIRESNSSRSTGLGVAGDVLWGVDRGGARRLFLAWNVAGALLVIGNFAILGLLLRIRGFLAWSGVIGLPVLCYALWAMQYVATQNLVHGAPKKGVYSRCSLRCIRIPQKLFTAYCIEKDTRRLPQGETFKAVVTALEGAEPSARQRRELLYCPFGLYFDKHPKPYEWNGRWAGMEVRSVPPEEIMLECPYHRGIRLLARDL